MKKHTVLFSSVVLVSVLIVGCGYKNDPSGLSGTWTLYNGDVAFTTAPPIPGRQVTFQIHDHSVLRSYNSNGKETSIPIEGKEHKLVFKPNGEYVIYSAGVAIEKEDVVQGMPIYESGTYEINKACLSLNPVTLNGTKPTKVDIVLRGSCGKKGGALEYKLENNTLAVMWESFYKLNDPSIKNSTNVKIDGKINFIKVSNDILLPTKIPQNVNDPDEFTSPKGTFYGLATPNATDNSIFIPVDSIPEDIIAQDPILDLKIISKQKSYIVAGLSTPEEQEGAKLSIHLLSRISPEEYLKYKHAELTRLGFEQTEFENDLDSDKWIPRAYKKIHPKEVIYLYEAVRERRVSDDSKIPRLYIVRARLHLPIDENKREKSTNINRDWNLIVQRSLLYYLAEEARFPEDE